MQEASAVESVAKRAEMVGKCAPNVWDVIQTYIQVDWCMCVFQFPRVIVCYFIKELFLILPTFFCNSANGDFESGLSDVLQNSKALASFSSPAASAGGPC